MPEKSVTPPDESPDHSRDPRRRSMATGGYREEQPGGMGDEEEAGTQGGPADPREGDDAPPADQNRHGPDGG